jgi:hypothetical protein
MIVFASLIKLHILKAVAYPIILPLLLVVICIVSGILIHYAIERPMLSWLRGFLSNSNRDPETVSSNWQSESIGEDKNFVCARTKRASST